jgi:FKBP-type peptidyl-prolyl cis-trans isomerase 2
MKKGDFIELDYTGKLDDGSVFDTTLKEVAIANNINTQTDFKPAIICLGENHLLPALEKGLIDQEIGTHHFDVSSENAFGKKSAKLLKLIPMKVFKQQKINPYPGLDINIDGAYGIIRTVSGGRVIVDFNHPLASKDVSYDIEVRKIVTDKKEKLNALLTLTGLHFDSVSVKENDATVVLEHAVPDELKQLFEVEAKKVGVDKIDYIVKKEPSKNHVH